MTDIAELKRRARKNDTDAISELADMYRFGKGVEKNRSKALYWNERRMKIFRSADEGGDNDALWELALWMAYPYHIGGTEEDHDIAEGWYQDLRRSSENKEIAKEWWERAKEKEQADDDD